LEQFARDLGLPITAVESRFDIQRVLDLVAGTTLEDAVNFAVLRSMNKAIYGPHREGHYALDMEHYCHFTSPIRRYPDLTVHRLVQRIIDGKKTPDDPFPALLALGFHCSDQERNAASAERDLILLKLLHFMKKQIGQTMEAVISRVFADGIHARCLNLPVDGFVPVTSLPPDKYRYERRGQMIVGFKEGNQFRLGDRITVKIAKVDMQERQLWMDFVKKSGTGEKITFRSPKSRPGDANATSKKREKVSKKKEKKSRRRR
jgi:ribonuclease R